MSERGPIRVLHLRDSPWVDGPGRTILETAARIDRSRIDYTIAPLVPDDGATHPLVVAARARGVPVQPVTDTGALAPLVERVTGLVDRLGIEILHSSEFRTNLVALWCRRRRPKLKLVSTAHGWIANDMRGRAKVLLGKLLLRRFDRVILVSRAMRRRLPGWCVPDRRLRVLHNALISDRFGAEPPRPKPLSRDPARRITLLNVGRLSVEKGQALLLHAIAALATEFPGLRLMFAGVGPLEQSLRDLSFRLGIGERVTFAGYVADMAPLYRDCDLVVQSSFTEGLPNVILEAAYLGVPIVATEVGGTAEVIKHGLAGWLVPPRSAAGLTAGIRLFLEEPERFAAMSASARARVEAHFSFAARTSEQTRLYLELARSPG